MPKIATLQSDFSGGEVSPFVAGRVDNDRYKKSLQTCLNFIPTIQGPVTKRPGTEYIANTRRNGVARLQAFNFSTTQAYMLEFGNNYVRFFKDNANITLGAKTITAVTLAHPPVVTSALHGYSNGDSIIIEDVLGMTQLNNVEFVVAGVAANTFTLKLADGTTDVDATGFDAYTSGGTANKIYEVTTSYTSTEVFDLKFSQSADVLYIAHESHAPRKLLRYGHASWQIIDLVFVDGPYAPQRLAHSDNTKMAFGSATGTGVGCSFAASLAITGAANNGSGGIRITAVNHDYLTTETVNITGVTGTVEANGIWQVTTIDANHFDLRGSTFVNAYVAAGTTILAPFVSTDVGRHIRAKEGSTWGWAIIKTYVDQANVTVDIMSTMTTTTGKANWRLGAYSTTTGFPSSVTFHEDRLFFGGPQQQMNGSKSGDYETFSPTAFDSAVAPDNAVSFIFNSNDVNVIEWISSDEKGLLTGTTAAAWLTTPSSQGEALSPTNITAKKSVATGSTNVQPVQAGKSTIFVQKSGRKIRELNYDFYAGGFLANDITQLASHISPTGIAQMAYQREPQGIVWCVRNDGVLAGMTFDRDSDALRVGWHRHVFGGYRTAANDQAFVESAQVLISSDELREDLWVIVQRYINGKVVRNIEYVTKIFDDTVLQRDAFFVDAGLTYDNPLDITAITKANPCVVTSALHGLSNGDKILITDVLGMTQLNSNTYLVAGATANTFQLHDLLGNAINSTAFTTYVTEGSVRKLITTVSGLNHLEGQTVSILADGSVRPSQVVTKGKIVLTNSAATIHVGLQYNSDGQTLRIEGGAADGTALGKTRRMHRVGMLLYRTLGLKIGLDFTQLDTIPFRSTADLMTRAPGLFSGIISESLEADYDFENNFCFRHDQPLPCTVLAIMPQLVETDR